MVSCQCETRVKYVVFLLLPHWGSYGTGNKQGTLFGLLTGDIKGSTGVGEVLFNQGF